MSAARRPSRTSLIPALAVTIVALAASIPAQSAGTDVPAAQSRSGCTASGRGFLRARLRGALDLDLAWQNAEMECAGGPRPDGRGLRLTIAGPVQGAGRRLRFVLGIPDAPEGQTVRSRPANLTLIFEGEQRMFATRGEDKCSIDELVPARVGALGGPRRSWQIAARGFCTAPASALRGGQRILVSRFDFVTEVTFEDEPAPDPAESPAENVGPLAVGGAVGGAVGMSGGRPGSGPARPARTVELPAH
jgi:hypothetical protein